MIIVVGYQFDYVFDWTMLKYPQIGGSSSRPRVSVLLIFLWINLALFQDKMHILLYMLSLTGNNGEITFKPWTISTKSREDSRFASSHMYFIVFCPANLHSM